MTTLCVFQNRVMFPSTRFSITAATYFWFATAFSIDNVLPSAVLARKFYQIYFSTNLIFLSLF